MPAQTIPFVDIEGVLRTWARGLDLGEASGRVFFAIPGKDPVFPLVTLARVGGGLDASLPVDTPTISFSVWAADKGSAADVLGRLVPALQGLASDVAGTAVLDSADVTLVLWQPDPVANKARYVVDASIAVRPHTP